MKPYVILGGYVATFFAILVAVLLFQRFRRKGRHPLPENLKLLRMPGEFLLSKVASAEEADLYWLIGALTVPLFSGVLVLQLLIPVFSSSPITVLSISGIVLVAGIFVSIGILQRRFQRRADYLLGFVGERYVAEWLDPLKASGWFIFHDVPFAGATGKFNLDHIAVGPRGLWVIETKTRRKRKAKPGRKAHEVEFDGRNIIWPWCEETESLRQVADANRALSDWLHTNTGKKYEPSAVIAIPGYFVVERKLGPIRLANPKSLRDVLTSPRNGELAPPDVDLIRRQLEAKCRDVEV